MVSRRIGKNILQTKKVNSKKNTLVFVGTILRKEKKIDRAENDYKINPFPRHLIWENEKVIVRNGWFGFKYTFINEMLDGDVFVCKAKNLNVARNKLSKYLDKKYGKSFAIF